MNPHKMNKVDISAMSEEDQKAFKMYGKAPAKNLLTKMQKDRKYFDSGDYMMNKAGVNTNQPLGTAIPTPEGVPHASPPGPTSPPPNLSSSPTNGIAGVAAQNSERAGSPTASLSQGSGQGNGHSGNVGVGISPAATSEAMEVPSQQHHHRRTSDSNHGARVSPPGTMRDHPSSSFPIAHSSGGFGSSPVKQHSGLGRRFEGAMEE